MHLFREKRKENEKNGHQIQNSLLAFLKKKEERRC